MRRRQKTSFAPFDGVGQQVPRVRHSAFLNPFAVTMLAACVHWFPCNAPHYGNTNRQVPLRLGWETIAARRKGKATVMRYFTTGGWKTAPALNLFESLEPHDTVEIEGLGGARPEALNVGLDAWDLMPMSETRVVEWSQSRCRLARERDQ